MNALLGGTGLVAGGDGKRAIDLSCASDATLLHDISRLRVHIHIEPLLVAIHYAAVAGKDRELLIQEAGKSPDFPSVLLKGYPPDPERSNDILFIGKHVDPALAHAILRHAKELGIRKILYSQVHDTFIIGPDKPLLVFPDIAGSLKEYYPDLDKEGDAVPKRGGGGEADAVAE